MGISSEITLLKKQAEDLMAAMDTHDKRLTDGIEQLLLPYLKEGETFPDVSLLNQLMYRWVSSTTEDLVAKDELHNKESGESQEAQNVREKTFSISRTGTIDTKGSLQSLHGSNALSLLGLSGETPNTPDKLVRMLSSAIETLERTQKIPHPLSDGTPVWTAEMLKQKLSALHNQLKSALSTVRREKQESKGTLTLKWQAMEIQRKAFRAGVDFVSTLAQAVGEDELADRLRPEGGRPARDKKSSDEETNPEEHPDKAS